MEICEVRVAFLESERAEGKAESYVVDGVGFGGGGCLGVGDGDFDLLSHNMLLSWTHGSSFGFQVGYVVVQTIESNNPSIACLIGIRKCVT